MSSGRGSTEADTAKSQGRKRSAQRVSEIGGGSSLLRPPREWPPCSKAVVLGLWDHFDFHFGFFKYVNLIIMWNGARGL
jgi:hypothetical protein